MSRAHYSPLRYPGGKGKLLPFVRGLVAQNGLVGGAYSEPYAGGANVALGLLLEDYVSEIYINDIDYSIYSFWYSVLNHTEDFMRKIWDSPVTMEQWQTQKAIERDKKKYSKFEVGFSTFFLNRTNRSGVIKGGVIGGNNQQGNYKIGARYNKRDLLDRINRIGNFSSKIFISNLDCLEFIKKRELADNEKELIFLDPPYYKKGKQLYTNFYIHDDHVKIAEAIKNSPLKHWIVTYDNAPEIVKIYSRDNIQYNLRYSASHTNPQGTEILYYSDALKITEDSLPRCAAA